MWNYVHTWLLRALSLCARVYDVLTAFYSILMSKCISVVCIIYDLVLLKCAVGLS